MYSLKLLDQIRENHESQTLQLSRRENLHLLDKTIYTLSPEASPFRDGRERNE